MGEKTAGYWNQWLVMAITSAPSESANAYNAFPLPAAVPCEDSDTTPSCGSASVSAKPLFAGSIPAGASRQDKDLRKDKDLRRRVHVV